MVSDFTAALWPWLQHIVFVLAQPLLTPLRRELWALVPGLVLHFRSGGHIHMTFPHAFIPA